MTQQDWTTLLIVLGTVVPALGVPMTMASLYLKSIRDHQASRYSQLLERIKHLDLMLAELSGLLRQFERDYTTKREWLRESEQLHQQLKQLTDVVVNIQLDMRNGISKQLAQAAQATMSMAAAQAPASK